MVDGKIVAVIKQYLAKVEEQGIKTVGAILYGSAARGEMRKNSDIDLIVLSPVFNKPHTHEQVDPLWLATTIDYRIEPIACGEAEWQTDDTRPILEYARREGILIPAA